LEDSSAALLKALPLLKFMQNLEVSCKCGEVRGCRAWSNVGKTTSSTMVTRVTGSELFSEFMLSDLVDSLDLPTSNTPTHAVDFSGCGSEAKKSSIESDAFVIERL
jgi:hypothetical protein